MVRRVGGFLLLSLPLLGFELDTNGSIRVRVLRARRTRSSLAGRLMCASLLVDTLSHIVPLHPTSRDQT